MNRVKHLGNTLQQ